MSQVLLSKFERLESEAHALAEGLRQARQELIDTERLPSPLLQKQAQDYVQRFASFQVELQQQLQRDRFRIERGFALNSLNQLRQYTQAVAAVDSARTQLAQSHARLQRADISDHEKSTLTEQLNQLREFVDTPAVPLNEQVSEFLNGHHALNVKLTEAFERPQRLTIRREEPATELTSEPPPKSVPVAQQTGAPTRNTQVDQANEKVVEEQDAEIETADDLIFDDINSDDAEKQILTAAELNDRFDQYQQHMLTGQNQANPNSSRKPDPTEQMPEDSVFDELDDDTASGGRDRRQGTIRGQLPPDFQQELTDRIAGQDSANAPRSTSSNLVNSPGVFTNPDSQSHEPPARSGPAAEPDSWMPISDPEPADTSQDQTTDESFLSNLPVSDYKAIQDCAVRADAAQNRFDRVSHLSWLIWELIAQGEYAMAFQLSQCLFSNVDKDLDIPAPPPWLLQLLILGDQVRFSSGRIAREFHRIAQTHRQSAMQIAEQPTTPLAYLLRAAIMRGTVTTASGVCADILRTYVIEPGQTQLYNYCSRIASFSSRAAGLKLDQYFYRPGAASIEQQARDIRARASSWKTEQFPQQLDYHLSTPLFARPNWSLKSAPAAVHLELTSQWRARQMVQSQIALLLTPILENNLTRTSVVEAAVKQLTAMISLSAEQSVVSVSEFERVRFEDNSLYRHAQQAIEFGTQWMILAASYPGLESVLVPQEINELRDEIDRRQGAVFQELRRTEKQQSDHAYRAALTACRRNMDRIDQLIHPGRELELGEPEPLTLFNAELLKITGLSLDEDWSCPIPPGILEHQLLEHLQRDPIDWTTACEQQLQAGSFRSVRMLLRLDHWNDQQRDRYRAELENRRRDTADSIHGLLERVKSQINDSEQMQIISSREADHYREQIRSIEVERPGEFQRDQIRDQLTDIRQRLDSRREAELQKMQQRLARLSQSGSSQAPLGPSGQMPSDNIDEPNQQRSETARPDRDRSQTGKTTKNDDDEPNEWALDV